MKLENYFKKGKAYIWKEKFAIMKGKVLPDVFAVVRDKKEITVIVDQTKIDSADEGETMKDYKIITFDMVLPFSLVGFMAKVSKALADEGISIFVISAYSTDHLLVREKDLPKAVDALENLGCKFIVNSN